MCNDALIDSFDYMTIECKWQVILTDKGYNDSNMWVPLECKNDITMFHMLKKKKSLCTGD